jgi:hypothetical protein
VNIYQRAGDEWYSIKFSLLYVWIKFEPFEGGMAYDIKIEYSGNISDIEYPIEYRIELSDGNYRYFEPESIEYDGRDEKIIATGHVLHETKQASRVAV